MGKTSIEWVRNAAGEQGHSINPIRFRNLETGKVGHHCEKISDGCKNCYASTMNGSPYLSGLTYIRLTYIADNTAKGEQFLDEFTLRRALRRKKPTAYFWFDMADPFGRWVPDEWIDRCFAVMALTPQHRHFVLTKRADRMREYLSDPQTPFRIARQTDAVSVQQIYNIVHEKQHSQEKPITWPLPQVWAGVSVEDQQRADERIPYLLQTPAAVRFLSVEPLLGPVDIARYLQPFWTPQYGADRPPWIDWVIVGGESGPGARPCDMEWIRSIVRQCKAAGVACFMKQLGARPIADGPEWVQNWTCGASAMPDLPSEKRWLRLFDRKGGDIAEWPEDLRIREMPTVVEGVPND